MKNLDELSLLFPEMDKKQQVSTLGGYDYYDGGGGSFVDGGVYDPGVVIVGSPSPPPYTPGPPFNTGDNQQGGGGIGYGGGSYENPNDSNSYMAPPLNPEMVNHLFSTFKFSPNFTDAEKAEYKKVLDDIDGSKLGDKILTEMDNYYKSNPNAVIPTVTNSLGYGKATASFDPNNKEYDFGDLLKSGLPVSSEIVVVAHEMFHNYQNITNQDTTKVNFEVDAYIFGSTVVKQSDSDYLALTNATSPVAFDTPITDAQTSFTEAWGQLVYNNDVSTANYARIINNFIDGSRHGSEYKAVIADPNAEPQWLKDAYK